MKKKGPSLRCRFRLFRLQFGQETGFRQSGSKTDCSECFIDAGSCGHLHLNRIQSNFCIGQLQLHSEGTFRFVRFWLGSFWHSILSIQTFLSPVGTSNSRVASVDRFVSRYRQGYQSPGLCCNQCPREDIGFNTNCCFCLMHCDNVAEALYGLRCVVGCRDPYPSYNSIVGWANEVCPTWVVIWESWAGFVVPSYSISKGFESKINSYRLCSSRVCCRISRVIYFFSIRISPSFLDFSCLFGISTLNTAPPPGLCFAQMFPP